MKQPILFLLLTSLIASPSALAQEKKTGASEQEKSARELAVEAAESVDPTLKEFERMKPETAEKIKTLVNEASSFLSGIRLQEALAKLSEADQLSEGKLFVVKNLIGACYTKIRLFPEAREEFKAALKLHPHSFQAKFNLAELDFVEAAEAARKGKEGIQAQWATAQKEFEALQNSRAVDEGTKKLMQFKVVICLLKQGKKEEAKKLVSTFSYIDDEPIYQMAHAAIEFDQDNKMGAQEWIDMANRIWKDSPQALVVYIDSFVELGWVDSLMH